MIIVALSKLVSVLFFACFIHVSSFLLLQHAKPQRLINERPSFGSNKSSLQKCKCYTHLSAAAKGFGSPSEKKKKILNKKDDGEAGSLKKVKGTTYNKAEQARALENLAATSAKTVLGRAVAETLTNAASSDDAYFWEMIPSLIISKFPYSTDDELTRVAGFLTHTLDPTLPKQDDHDNKNDPWRPTQEIHAYMPGIGLPRREPFLDPSKLALVQQLEENYDIILQEYKALVKDMKESGKDRFQSVTSLNYESGWKTLVLFYNGRRIPNFPYHLCPVTTRILETVPIGGRIAGFNRQAPNSGIPLHTDGNNMWLTVSLSTNHISFLQAFVPLFIRRYLNCCPCHIFLI